LFFLEGPVEIHFESLNTREAFMPLAFFDFTLETNGGQEKRRWIWSNWGSPRHEQTVAIASKRV